ncbi:FGGY-family carbohydrate kinase, partial [Weizmannia sp. CD-2023]
VQQALFTALGALKIGMDILVKQEKVKLKEIVGHGGLFKTEGVGQRMMAAALNVPVSVMDTAGESGAWAIAVLASYMVNKMADETLEAYLDHIFAEKTVRTVYPDPKDVKGFEQFMERYLKGLAIERAAVNSLT